MDTKIRNIPLSLDEQLLTEIDAVAAEIKESRSGAMRRAIREGLPLVKAGGKADVLTLDSELSGEVDQAAKETELKRNKVLLEAIRTGLHAFWSKKVSEKLSLAGVQDPEKIAVLTQIMEESYRLCDDPMMKEHRRMLAERGAISFRLRDLLEHVPEAKHRYELMNRLAKIRNSPGGIGGGMNVRLSTAELEWQIGMSEKYGPHPASWPEDISKAHRAAEDAKNAPPEAPKNRRK